MGLTSTLGAVPVASNLFYLELAALLVLWGAIIVSAALLGWAWWNARRVHRRFMEQLARKRARMDVDVACWIGWHDTVLKAIEIRVDRGNRRLLRVIEGGGETLRVAS